MQLTNKSSWIEGQRVKGVYCGQPFTGVINGQTRPTPDYKNVQFHVDLDAPIVVFGAERNMVIVRTNSDNNIETV